MVKQLIVTADDFGLHPDFNHGILEAVMYRKVNAVSVMIDRRIIPDWQINILKNEYSRVGLHLDLGKRREWTKYSESDKEKKVSNQIHIFENTFDFLPDHIDGHYNVHLEDKTVFDYVVKYAKEHKTYVRGRGVDIEKLKNLSVKTCDHFHNSLEEEPAKLLENAKDGVNELMLHPGFYYRDTEYPTSLTDGRQRDLDFLLSKEFEKLLKKHNIELMEF